MTISDVTSLNDHYNDLFRQGDLDGLLALYEHDAILRPAPG